MNTDIMNDRLTIKDIVFTKALPNYKIPVPTDGYKIFPCTNCGDNFLFESSYEYHINRKSLKICYFCRHCMNVIVFYNRCKLLSHIRSHGFKSATITVADLKIEPLPLENFNISVQSTNNNQEISGTPTNAKQFNECYECKEIINKRGIAYVDRAAHYMQDKKEVHTCPICMFLFPTACALETHLRLHLHIPPFFCPECGVQLTNKLASYPFDHDCQSFKTMKASVRIKCKLNDCKTIFHPDDYIKHYKTHLNKVNKCPYTYKHEDKQYYHHNLFTNYDCPLCPKKFITASVIEKHLNSHSIKLREKLNDQIYPCITCNVVYQHMCNLITHHINKHSSLSLKNILSKISINKKNKNNQNNKNGQNQGGPIYHRVIKKCSKCLRSFTYRCLYENIKTLPNECPYKCSINNDVQNATQSNQGNDNLQIECFLCKRKINEDWADIKTHYAAFHKHHKCLDIKVLVKKLNHKLFVKKSVKRNSKHVNGIVKKRFKKNKVQADKVALPITDKDNTNEIPNDTYICVICNFNCESTQHLETHMITHRDPCTAYQCLECGQSFVVKRSFSTHLLLQHGISDVQEYIDKKPCYNELAMLKRHNDLNTTIDEPVKENQCRICRDQFENSNDLEKHFRVHGMAFLMKNCHKNSSP